MIGRRRHERYRLNEPMGGTLRLREEVAIERWDAGEIVVLSTAASRPDERLTLELPAGRPRKVEVNVLESRPVVAPDGSLRHRIRLAVERKAARGAGRQGS
jgi:hypothetical protein